MLIENGKIFLDKWEKISKQKICAIDIDGVLNYYPKPWVDFLNIECSTKYNNLVEIKENIPYNLYRRTKSKYRTQGIKRTLEPRKGSRELLEKLKQMKYLIILITARPVHEHINLFRDTIYWLNLNFKDLYDHIIFSEDKHLEVLQKFTNIKFIIEDHRTIANTLSKWGYKVFLINNEYNQGKIGSNVTKIGYITKIIEYI